MFRDSFEIAVKATCDFVKRKLTAPRKQYQDIYTAMIGRAFEMPLHLFRRFKISCHTRTLAQHSDILKNVGMFYK